jgi:iron complex transport system ATP-binding protein
MIAIRTDQITYRYSARSRQVLESLSLELKAGQFLAIIGPNGAAKSTLLRILAGITRPTSGHCYLDDQSYQDLSAAAMAKRIAFAPQSASVPFDFTALEVTLMGRHPHNRAQLGWRRDSDVEWARRALADVDALQFSDRIFNQLSGGEKQRIIVARSLCQSRQCLLLDEPTSAQDLHHRLLLLETLKEACSRGGAVAIATHDLTLVVQFATHVLVLKDGKRYAHGDISAIMTEQLFHDVFQIGGSVHRLANGINILIPTERRGS